METNLELKFLVYTKKLKLKNKIKFYYIEICKNIIVRKNQQKVLQAGSECQIQSADLPFYFSNGFQFWPGI